MSVETQLRETSEDTVTNSSRWDTKISPKLLPVMPVVMKKDFSIFLIKHLKTSDVKMSKCVMFCFKYAGVFSGLVRFGFSDVVSHHWIKCFIFKIISKASSVGVFFVCFFYQI